MTTRPNQHLAAIMRDYPRLGHAVDGFRSQRGKTLPNWPEWCMLPMGGWYAIACQALGADKLWSIEQFLSLSYLTALGTWRYTQGIYRLDPDLLAALADSDLTGDLPSEVMYRLPEWCMYIETPGLPWTPALHGFWAHLEWDANDGHSELRILLDTNNGLEPVIVHLGEGTLAEAIFSSAQEGRRNLDRMAKSDPGAVKDILDQPGLPELMEYIQDPDHARSVAQSITPLISILLYLCSEAPAIEDTQYPEARPGRPQRVRTKTGWRLFPANGPRIWTVGRELGERLRQARPQNPPSDADPRTIRPHIRRGHWHGYWLGPRDGKRQLAPRWIYPMLVQGSGPEPEGPEE